MAMSWYDRAELYDIAFSWDIEPELVFLGDIWQRYAAGPLSRIYEPFCGTGRLIVPLAEQGVECVGVDLSQAMLACLNRRVADRDLPLTVTQSDVCDFRCRPPVDLVVTLIDSFRHLVTEAAAADALRAFHASLRPQGLLIVGLQIGEAPIALDEHNAWEMERDGIVVETAVFSLRQPGPESGTELMRSVLFATYPDGRTEEIVSDEPMRLYTRESLIKLAEDNGPFEFLAAFDYHELNAAQPTEDDTADGNTVFVFRAT